MKKFTKFTALSAVAALALSISGCGDDTPPPAAHCNSSVIDVVLPSYITSNMSLDANKTYGLDGKVVVNTGATLTIAPGTHIAGCTPSSFLLIDRGSFIDANGTLAQPIVFTSQTDELNNSFAGAKGEWGGLVLLGNGYTNAGANQQYEASTETFGLADTTGNAESSGVLNYVVIKHTGYAVEANKELNGLSLAGVGSGTTLTNIAIIGGADDGIEIWGGAANITGLYVYNASDDSIDTDLGYQGTITNAYVKQLAGHLDKSTFDSSGLEFGNDLNLLASTASTATKPTIIDAVIEVESGGIYLKNDAGFIMNNVLVHKLNSADANNTVSYALVTHRTIDTFDTNATSMTGPLSLLNDANNTNLYATANTKDSNTTLVANTYWPANITGGTVITDGSGITDKTATVWKGTAGDPSAPLE